MPTIFGENLKYTGDGGVGTYYMLRSGYWMKREAGGLWSGPYSTTDGVTFTLTT